MIIRVVSHGNVDKRGSEIPLSQIPLSVSTRYITRGGQNFPYEKRTKMSFRCVTVTVYQKKSPPLCRLTGRENIFYFFWLAGNPKICESKRNSPFADPGIVDFVDRVIYELSTKNVGSAKVKSRNTIFVDRVIRPLFSGYQNIYFRESSKIRISHIGYLNFFLIFGYYFFFGIFWLFCPEDSNFLTGGKLFLMQKLTVKFL